MITFPKYDMLSENSLKDLHSSIKKAIKIDAETPEGQDKPYGVREFSDWKRHADAIESAMESRGIEFSKIKW
ncbi:MAG: hypothetical protein ACXACY_22135 [Candidatus Hodarchaeales archaeon]|jgi:hypothetical protein